MMLHFFGINFQSISSTSKHVAVLIDAIYVYICIFINFLLPGPLYIQMSGEHTGLSIKLTTMVL